jgi:hypothetical protein
VDRLRVDNSCRTTVLRGVTITGHTKGGRVNETVDGVTSPLDAGWFTTPSSKEEIDLPPRVRSGDVLAFY